MGAVPGQSFLAMYLSVLYMSVLERKDRVSGDSWGVLAVPF